MSVGSDSFAVTADISDEGTGLSYARVIAVDPNNNMSSAQAYLSLATGNANQGTYTGTLTFNSTMSPGTWNVYLSAMDSANNLGSFTLGTITVVNDSGGDSTTPGAPTDVTATAGDAQANLAWTAPSSDGGSALTGYTVTSSPSGITKTVEPGATSTTITGLTNNSAYTFTVKATNAIGDSPASTPSNQVTPLAPTSAPGAPTDVTATAGDAQANLAWTAPSSDGGSALTGYTVTSSPSGITKTVEPGATSTTITGLINNTAYTFTVKATNAIGDSPASTPSNQVTPLAPGPSQSCIAAQAHLSSAQAALERSHDKLTTAKKKLRLAKAAALSVRAQRVKKAKAKIAAAKKKLRGAKSAVAAARVSAAVTC